jgi:hypothetical protein
MRAHMRVRVCVRACVHVCVYVCVCVCVIITVVVVVVINIESSHTCLPLNATACQAGKYGVNCASKCSSGCAGGVCDTSDGSCSCIEGRTRPKCDRGKAKICVKLLSICADKN